MTARELYDILFTEYAGPVGYAPAIATLVVCAAVAASVVYGGVMLGKAAFAHTPVIETQQHS
jgi:hypothetical protein